MKDFYEKNKVGTIALSAFFFVVLLYFSTLLARFIVRSGRVLKLCARVEYIQEQADKSPMKKNDETYENQKCDANTDEDKSN